MIAESAMKLEVAAGDAHGITLEDLQAFIDHVQRVAPHLMGSKIWGSSFSQEHVKVLDLVQVRGDIPAAPKAPAPDTGC